MRSTSPFGALALAAALMAGLCACTSSGSSAGSEGGSVLSNLFFYGGTTVPPAAAVTAIEVPDCPPVDVSEGGAAMRTLAGKSADAGAVRSQISISNVARECAGQKDGSVLVKVGVEGRALLGPGGGGAGRFDAPVYIVLKRGDRILTSRARRVAVIVPPGDTQGSFVVVEEGLVVPPGIGGEFEIEVGLGSGPAGAARSASKGRRARS